MNIYEPMLAPFVIAVAIIGSSPLVQWAIIVTFGFALYRCIR